MERRENADETKFAQNNEKQIRSKKSRLNRATAGDYVIAALLIVFTVLAFYPVWFTLIGSFNNGTDYLKGGVYLVPRVFTWANYKVIVSDERIWHGLLITVLRCLTGPAMLVGFTAFVAYGMSRKELKGKKVFNIINLITMFFGGGMIPLYLLCKMLGLLNTFWIYVLPGMYNVYDMILMRAFFNGLPEDLHEAAVIDGASEFKIFFTIVAPCSKPILATVLMWALIGHWNDYLTTEIYAPLNKNLNVLQYVLQKIINGSASAIPAGVPAVVKKSVSAKTVSLAAMMFGSLPMFVMFPFFQRFFTKGIYVGSLKG